MPEGLGRLEAQAGPGGRGEAAQSGCGPGGEGGAGPGERGGVGGVGRAREKGDAGDERRGSLLVLSSSSAFYCIPFLASRTVGLYPGGADRGPGAGGAAPAAPEGLSFFFF